MKNKKLLQVIAAMMMSALLLTGCSGPAPSKKEDSAKTETSKSDDKKEDKKDDKKEDKKDKAASADYTIKDEVLFDDDKVSFSIKEINMNGLLGPEISVSMENKTDDPLVFGLNYAAVNGYMTESLLYEELQPKTKGVGSISFSSTFFEETGISSMDEVTIFLTSHIADNYDAESYLISDEFTFYPTGKSASDIKYEARELQNSDEVVVDEKDVKVVVLGVDPDSFMGQAVKFYIENNTDQSLSFTRDSVVVNGNSLDSISSLTVSPGKKAYHSLYLFSEELEKNDIKDIEEIRFNVKVSDAENWFADPILEKPCEYKVK